jgi:hypothetical protein
MQGGHDTLSLSGRQRPKDDTVENRQGQGIMSPKVIYGQERAALKDIPECYIDKWETQYPFP